jgi:hypothetical protein
MPDGGRTGGWDGPVYQSPSEVRRGTRARVEHYRFLYKPSAECCRKNPRTCFVSRLLRYCQGVVHLLGRTVGDIFSRNIQLYPRYSR